MGRKFATNFDSLRKAINKEEQKGNSSAKRDERFYSIPWNGEKSSFDATIRFLPSIDECPPRVKYQHHTFKGKSGKFFSERCLKDLGKECPVCEYTWETYEQVGKNKDLWKERCGNMTNKVKYISNILVIDDKANPENNGKVFLYSYPPTIADYVLKKVSGEKDDDGSWLRKPVNVFDYYEGCNFKLKGGTNKGGYPDYSDCYFLDPSELFGGDDDKIEEVHNQRFSLIEFMDEDKYKEYGVLKVKLNRVLGLSEDNEEDEDVDYSNTSKSKVESFTNKKDKKDEEEEKKKKEIEDNFKAVTGSDKEVSKDEDVDLNMMDDDEDDDFMKKLASQVDDD